MIRNELVTHERWVTPEHFRRLLAIYQVLPGPEAHELCVHFGMLARGRWGGVLAGLGFMLPGFVLMFFLSWLYVRIGLTNGIFQAVFLGVQPAVIALIIRACHRIGRHCLVDVPLWTIALLAGAAEILHVSFWITLPLAGVGYLVAAQRRWLLTAILGLGFAGGLAFFSPVATRGPALEGRAVATSSGEHGGVANQATPIELFGSGLRAGLLTFGGAYTAIPFLERDAVQKGRWMTQRDFLDGVALSGILPAPLIIFSTFVGFLGGGPWGALAMTLGVFLPAFSFSLLFHRHLEAVVHHRRLRHFLEGVTAAVVALIAVTAARLALAAISEWRAAAIATATLVVLYVWQAKAAVPVVVFAAGLAGAWIFHATT
jgi:chromate transporter